jgi:hypothetical protein
MTPIEDLLRKLVAEHQILKEMQAKILDNYDLVMQNQQFGADNQEILVRNQATIIHNQEIIVGNQFNIIRNQKSIVQNQVTLDVILQTQAQVLNLVKHLTGNSEEMATTESHIEHLRAVSQENLRFKAFNESMGL